MAEFQTKSPALAEKVAALKNKCADIKTADIQEKIAEILIDFGIAGDALSYVASELHNNNMAQADKLYQEAWFRMSKTTLSKRLWSETELTTWLNKTTKAGKLKEVCETFTKGLGWIKVLKKYFDKINPIIEVVSSLQNISLNGTRTVTINSEKMDKCSLLRAEVRLSRIQFKAFMDIIGTINGFSPRGIKSYIEYNLAVFNGAEKMFSIVDSYVDVIVDLAKENAKAWEEAINNDHSYLTMQLAIMKDADPISYLDRLERQKKRAMLYQQREKNQAEIKRQLE